MSDTTHRIEFTARLPDGTLRTVGIDVAGDAANPRDRTLAAHLGMCLAGALKRCRATVEHQRGPFGVGTQGAQQ